MTNQEAIIKLKTYVDTIHMFPTLLGTLSENKSVIESLEVYELSIKAMERQEMMEPNLVSDGYADGNPVYDYWECPICGTEYGIDSKHDYCPKCGQALEWRIEEDE